MEFLSGFNPKDTLPLDRLLPLSRPFWLQHEPRSKESRPIGDAIFTEGIDAAGSLYPGHGYADISDAKKAMGLSTAEEWLESSRSDIEKAREMYDRVFLFGQSMGGAISIIMAEEGLVDGIALTAPAFILPFGAGTGATLLGWVNINISDPPPKDDPYCENYAFLNSNAVKQLFKISKIARKNLHKITCPVLECHSHLDNVITSKVVDELRENIHGPFTNQWFDKSGHSMPLSVQGEEIAEAIATFFKDL